MVTTPDENVHDPETCEDDHEELWAERFMRTRTGLRIRRTVRRAQHARSLWRDRNAETVGAVLVVDRAVLEDEPRLRALFDHDLREKLTEYTPLRWRLNDLRWCWANARRAIRGEVMETMLPHDELVEVEVATEHPELFERAQALVHGTRRRKPRA